MNAAPPFAARAALAAAAALSLAVGLAPAASAAPTTLVTTPGRSIDTPDPERASALEAHGDALLRADGSFGSFLEDPFGQRGSLGLLTYAAAGNSTQGLQDLTGTQSGSLGYPRIMLSGVEGYDWAWIPPDIRVARPGEPADSNGAVRTAAALIAVDDLGRIARTITIGGPDENYGGQLVATGSGLRLLSQARGNTGTLLFDSRGRRVARLPQVSNPTGLVGRARGFLVSSYSTRPSWSQRLLQVSTAGKVSFVRDDRGNTITADPLADTKHGVLLSMNEARRLGLRSSEGKVTSRPIDQLGLPWSERCRAYPSATSRLDWAMNGPSGAPMVAVSCVVEADRTEDILESFAVGLDRNLRASWIAPLPVVAYGQRAPKPQLAPGGRLQVVGASLSPLEARFSSWRAPGTPASVRGRVMSVSGPGDEIVATIRCSRPAGSVCSGTANLSRGGAPVKVAYALKGRPGRRAAVIKRHFDRAPAGNGRLRVTLTK
ncbi:MAG: hypothetical protein Q7T55_06580 [Solirubrobacteraceae bacterium]|nr:hypothetical protein [Solirubrobacteraceae bacterium]